MKVLLKDIADIKAGQGAPQGDEKYSTNGIPFIKAGNLHQLLNGFSVDKLQKVSNDVASQYKLKLYPKGTILFAKSGMSCMKGYVYVLPCNAYVVNHLACIIPYGNYSEYLKYYLNYHKPSYLIKDNSYPSISLEDIGNQVIDFKSKKIQIEIIKQMKLLEQNISYLKIVGKKYDDLIKARFIEMFGDAVDNPMGWEKRKLQEIVTDDCTISYGIVQTGNAQEKGVPVFRPVDIVNKVPKLTELKKTTEEISNKYKRTILKGRELLITVRANIADTCIVGEEFKGCNVGRGIVPIRIQEDIMVLEFLKYLLDSKHLNDNIKSKAKGITLIQLNMEDLKEVELISPPIEKQMDFVEFAKQADKSRFDIKKSIIELEREVVYD